MAEPGFYIGYLPAAPPATARFIRRIVVGLLVSGPVLASLWVGAQGRFSDGVFEFGTPRRLSGRLEPKPAPSLVVSRPGDGVSRYLLVSEGKHGASDLLERWAGKRVSLRGTLIFLHRHTMVEVVAGSIENWHGLDPGPGPGVEELGEVTLTGEIVDAKCYYGVMKPGNLKPHRACAARCISGGVPPILVVRDRSGHARHLLLVGKNGEPVNAEVLAMVAEPVQITGELERTGGLLVLRTDPAGYRRVP